MSECLLRTTPKFGAIEEKEPNGDENGKYRQWTVNRAPGPLSRMKGYKSLKGGPKRYGESTYCDHREKRSETSKEEGRENDDGTNTRDRNKSKAVLTASTGIAFPVFCVKRGEQTLDIWCAEIAGVSLSDHISVREVQKRVYMHIRNGNSSNCKYYSFSEELGLSSQKFKFGGFFWTKI